MSITDADLPEFSASLRGFDRRQVTDYLIRLREYAAEMEQRARLAEGAASTETGLRDRLAAVAAEARAAGLDGPELLARVEALLEHAGGAVFHGNAAVQPGTNAPAGIPAR